MVQCPYLIQLHSVTVYHMLFISAKSHMDVKGFLNDELLTYFFFLHLINQAVGQSNYAQPSITGRKKKVKG